MLSFSMCSDIRCHKVYLGSFAKLRLGLNFDFIAKRFIFNSVTIRYSHSDDFF